MAALPPPASRLAALFKRFFAAPRRREPPDDRQSPVPVDAPNALPVRDLAFAHVLHDLRNQLMVALGLADALHRRVPPGYGDQQYEELQRCLERASELIRGLLTGAGVRSTSDLLVDLNEVVQRVVNALPATISEQIEVRRNLWPGGAFVRGSLRDFEEILLNVALNARDALPQGGVLSIETHVFDDPSNSRVQRAGPHVRLRVADTGQGMSHEVLARIFEPFFTTKKTGTGLGLSSVALKVEQLGGRLNVESYPGVGTCVTIHFPLGSPRSTG